MTFLEFVSGYTSLAINNIPDADYEFLKNTPAYSSLFKCPKVGHLAHQNMRFRGGILQAHKSTPYTFGDRFMCAFVFEWSEIRDTLSDFDFNTSAEIDVMSVL